MIYAPESYRLSKTLHNEHPEILARLSKGHDYDMTTNIFQKLHDIFLTEKPCNSNNYVRIIGLEGSTRAYKYICTSYILPHPNLYKWKVILPKSNGSGAIGEVLSMPLIGEPMLGHTQTFISIGSFDSEFEAHSVLKYLKTKFTRALLSTLKITQDNKKAVWRNVPIQDFTPASDINWTKSVNDIDTQLYRKYGLEENEIGFIEKMIKPME